MRKILFITVIALLVSTLVHAGSEKLVLFEKNKTLEIFISEIEKPVVHTAVEILQGDVKKIFNAELKTTQKTKGIKIIAGTLDNPDIKKYIREKNIKISEIDGHWEAFQIQIVNNQLIVLGSDARGTAYGLLEISRLIDVSPWEWWGDCKPEKKIRFELPVTYHDIQQPAVQYRGIFINDESDGLTPWSTKIFDTENKTIGPKTYAKIFELLLRLRANTIWPAMHPKSGAFFLTSGNKEMATKFGIVVGTSHHEPMMRNTSEWSQKKDGEYNYLTNENRILDFWTDRVKQLPGMDCYYTLGIRGLGDTGMIGASSVREQVNALGNVIEDQKDILGKYINPDVSMVPKVFVPYKEVLKLYDNGLNIPDDVTMMWCDDNYGYITKFNGEKEQLRSGGSGVYYHLSYWGQPHEYTWLSSTSPALVFWQMKKSFDTGNKKLWIVNVGDIKPAEMDLEFFLDLGWKIDKLNANNFYPEYKQKFIREFGKKTGTEIDSVMQEYYSLAFIRKPELMGWSRQDELSYPNKLSPVKDTEFKPFDFGDQISKRLTDYEAIMQKTDKLLKTISKDKKDAFYQLIYFPVHASAEMNRKLLYAQKARLFAKYGLPVANEYVNKSIHAYAALDTLVKYYNEKMSHGKWNYMMHSKAWKQPVYASPSLPDSIILNINNNEVLIWAENNQKPFTSESTMELTPFVKQSATETFISVFTFNNKKATILIKQKPKWITIREEDLQLKGESRLNISINTKVLSDKESKGEIVLHINEKDYRFKVSAISLKDVPATYAVECNKLVNVDGSDYTAEGELPVKYNGLGYSQQAIELKPGVKNALTYKIFTSTEGIANVIVRLLPTHPVNSSDIRYAISIDNEEPQIISYKTDFIERSNEWKDNVSRNQAVSKTQYNFIHSGEHTIRIYALDGGVVLDQLSVDFELVRNYYELPCIKK